MHLWFMGLNYSCNQGAIKSHSPHPGSVQVIGGQRAISMTVYPILLQHFMFATEIWQPASLPP